MSSGGPGTRAGVGRLGYLLSRYPSTNHTYLLREVRALRAAGLDLVVAAVDGDDRAMALVPPEEREERALTFVVKRQGVFAIVAAHVATAVTRPAGYLAGIGRALVLARADLRRVVYNLIYFAEAVVVGRHLARRGCTHVHTHYATTVALLAARVFPFKLSASIHGSAEFIDPDAQRLREKVAACDFVRVISTYGQSQVMLASPADDWQKIAIVRLGVDPAEFERAPFRPAPVPFRLVSVGQLQPAKGFYVVLRALAALASAGREIALTLVGDGPDRSGLERYANELGITPRVRFAGALTQPDVRAVLRQSDAFVLASFAEGIPVVLMEAMASGLPCIASRITGIPELIDHGRDGLLFTPSDVGALADALAYLMDHGDQRLAMSNAAHRRIREEYNLSVNTAALARLFITRLDPTLG